MAYNPDQLKLFRDCLRLINSNCSESAPVLWLTVPPLCRSSPGHRGRRRDAGAGSAQLPGVPAGRRATGQRQLGGAAPIYLKQHRATLVRLKRHRATLRQV